MHQVRQQSAHRPRDDGQGRTWRSAVAGGGREIEQGNRPRQRAFSRPIDDVLETMAMPSCLYAGEADPIFMEAKLASERIPDARFFAIPGLAHLPAFVASSNVLPPVMAFLHSIP
jgi:hypothetical protein